jgi:hypothetical protein
VYFLFEGLPQEQTDIVNIAYSFTYMPPRYPLLQPREIPMEQPPPYITNPRTKYIIQVRKIAYPLLKQMLNNQKRNIASAN